MKIFVEAHPSSKKESIIKINDKKFIIYVKEPPLKGKANKAIIEVLSNFLKVPKSSILLLKGEKGKNKIFEILK